MHITGSCKMQVMPQNRKLLGTVNVAKAVGTAYSRLLYFSFVHSLQAIADCQERE